MIDEQPLPLADYDPLETGPQAAPAPELLLAEDEAESPELAGLARLWADIAAAGWRETILRYASHTLVLLLLAGAIGVGQLNLGFLVDRIAPKVALGPVVFAAPEALAEAEAEPVVEAVSAAPAVVATLPAPSGAEVSRRANIHTLIPTRGRSQVITYTVQGGDTLFGIAERYALKPETVLWGNYFTLKDDPHTLRPGQVLNILPVDGTYHYVTQGNTLEQIAKFYRVEPQAILDWGGNSLDSQDPALVPSTWLVIPGGQRELQVWAVPTIKRETRASRANNFGQCPGGYSGAVGVGSFVWPADNHFLSGYDFSGIHRGVDIKAPMGVPIYAADGGVVVYAGWNDFGYGNLVVIDHGNGWQSVYAHLSQWNVVCGQSVYQGNVIGLSGSTGRSSGAHLHFELRYEGGFVNPWTVLP